MKQRWQVALLVSLMVSPLGGLASGFEYQNKPINPACIALFNDSEADFPYIHAINVSTCQHSNAASKDLHTDGKGFYFFYENDKDASAGMYGYRYVGRTTNGIDVLETQSSGGGTLVASELLLTRLTNMKQAVYDSEKTKIQSITVLTLLGYAIGGDRCTGSFAKVSLKGNKLAILQYAGDNASDCGKKVTRQIDLSHL